MWSDLINRFAQPIINFWPLLPKIILGLFVGAVAIKILLEIVQKLLKVGRVPRTLIDIIASLGAIILWIMLLSEVAKFVGLSSIAVTISGSLVVLGFALANGATALTSDVISAFFLAKDRDFNIGYTIKTADIEGEIIKIDVRKIRVRGKDGKLFVIPNANLDRNGWCVIDRGDNHK